MHQCAGNPIDIFVGKGSGLSFQELPDFCVITTTYPMVGPPNDGNHNGPRRSFLGMVNEHDNGMADLLTGEEGIPLVFSPRDINDGGNMVMWDDAKGGRFPWDANKSSSLAAFFTQVAHSMQQGQARGKENEEGNC